LYNIEMSELNNESKELLDDIARFSKIRKGLAELGLVAYFDIKTSLPFDDPNRVSVLVASAAEKSKIDEGIKSRLRSDTWVMSILEDFGVETSLSSPIARAKHITHTATAHYINRPNARQASELLGAMELALEAHLEARDYQPPDYRLPTLEEIFPTD